MSSEDISFIGKWNFLAPNEILFRISLETSRFDSFFSIDWLPLNLAQLLL